MRSSNVRCAFINVIYECRDLPQTPWPITAPRLERSTEIKFIPHINKNINKHTNQILKSLEYTTSFLNQFHIIKKESGELSMCCLLAIWH